MDSSKIELNHHNYNTRLTSNIILLLLGRLVSLFGTNIYNFALSLYVLKATGSGLSFGTTLFFGALPRILLGPFAGAIADKVDRKKMVVMMDILSGIIVLALFGITMVDKLRLVYIYASSFLLTTTNTFFDIPFQASVPNIVDDKSLMKTNSLNQSISSLARFIGPILGGLIFTAVNINIFLLINGICFILSGISEAFIDFNFNKKNDLSSETKEIVNEGSKNILNQIKEGFIYLKTNEALFILFMFAIFINFFFAIGTSVPFPYIINNVLKLSSSQFGFIEGASSAGMLLGSIIMSIIPEKKKKYKTLVYGLLALNILLVFIGIPAIPIFTNFSKTIYFIFYIMLMIIMSIVLIFVNLPIQVTMQRLIPDNMRGRIFGLVETIAGGITPIGYILSGIFTEVLPVYIIPMASGVILILLSIKMIANKSIKEL